MVVWLWFFMEHEGAAMERAVYTPSDVTADRGYRAGAVSVGRQPGDEHLHDAHRQLRKSAGSWLTQRGSL
jgi:hypothetical protein